MLFRSYKHEIVELCTAVKGLMLDMLLEQQADKVVYLDPDTILTYDLSPVEELLNEHSIVLTPHLVEDEGFEDSPPINEFSTLKYGTYNLGFIAVSATDSGKRFTRWWRNRLLRYCWDDTPNGIFDDQRWCDLVPGMFDGVHILRDPGYNVACWNLNTRPIRFTPSGAVEAAGSPLRFIHFTKVFGVGETMIRHFSRNRTEPLELMHWYMDKVRENRFDRLPSGWAFDCYDDGVPISPDHRIFYRKHKILEKLFPTPFETGPHSYRDWYNSDRAAGL